MEIIKLKTKRLEANFNLLEKILDALRKNKVMLGEKDILVVSSKILALSQGRVVDLAKIVPSKAAMKLKATHYGKGPEDPRMIELILREADKFIPGKMILAMKDGILIPSAGIDLSNVPKGFAILWPRKPFGAAEELRKNLQKKLFLKNIGIIISDSHCTPLRWGVTGIAIGFAGFLGVEDERGRRDLFGNKLKVTRKAVGDSLASAALVVMGEAAERVPFAVIRGAPAKFTSRRQKKNEICVRPDDCIFGGIYGEKFKREFLK